MLELFAAVLNAKRMEYNIILTVQYFCCQPIGAFAMLELFAAVLNAKRMEYNIILTVQYFCCQPMLIVLLINLLVRVIYLIPDVIFIYFLDSIITILVGLLLF